MMVGSTNAGCSAKEEKTVTAGTSAITVTPSTGKLLSKVTVNPTAAEALPNGALDILFAGDPAHNSVIADKTIKDIICIEHDTYRWIGVANDSAGDLWNILVTAGGTITSIKLAADRLYNAKALAFDGTNVWVVLASGSYNDRNMLRFPIDAFISKGTYYNKSNVTYEYLAVCYDEKEDKCIATGGYTSGAGGAFIALEKDGTSKSMGLGNACPNTSCVSVCMYNNIPTLLAANGQIVMLDSWPDVSTTKSNRLLKGSITGHIIANLNGYLCVAATKSDGTYLYHTNGTFDTNTELPYTKISDEVCTPIGLTYVNGYYVMAYNAPSGEMRYWMTEDIENKKGTSFGSQSLNNGMTLSGAYNNYILATGKLDGTNAQYIKIT